MAFAAQMAPGTAMPSMPSASTIPSAPWRDRFALKAPNGVAFSEIRGYETWQPVAVSETDEGLKIIAGNAAMMQLRLERPMRPARPTLNGTIGCIWAGTLLCRGRQAETPLTFRIDRSSTLDAIMYASCFS